jgi:cytochrome P450
MSERSGRDGLPEATVAESLGVVAGVVTPVVARGVIMRRPRVLAMAEAMDLDAKAVKRVQRLRDRYGSGPLRLRIPGRSQAVILDPAHVRRVLDATPEPFATATTEKRAALSHFEPKGALISHGAERAVRRRLNERVLEGESPVHRLGERFVRVAEEEAAALLAAAGAEGTLDWDAFAERWFRMVRRVVFGEGAAEDHELSAMMAQLRADANWAFLKPKRKGLRERFLARVRAHLERAEPGSLSEIAARVPKTEDTAPEHQVPQWLFAYDPAGMATFRGLALLASRPAEMARARAETEARRGAERQYLPFLRATVMESLRLWPTTPMVLRQTTRETEWEEGVLPAGTGILIFAPFFHRDDERLPYAHRFAPEVWLQDPPAENWPLIPFSGGPGICPGRNVVLLTASAMLAALVEGGREIRLLSPGGMGAEGPLPGTLNHFGIRFALG